MVGMGLEVAQVDLVGIQDRFETHIMMQGFVEGTMIYTPLATKITPNFQAALFRQC
jgi:hypothetical protein